MVVENDKKIPIPVFFPNHYHCRGETLRNMSRAEYYCLVDIKEKPNNVEKQIISQEKRKPGRKHSKFHEFGVGHPLRATHVQVLRSFQKIPIYTKRPPEELPKLDSDGEPENKNVANNFARYYLTAFRPEVDDYDDEHRDLSLQFKWSGFCKFVEELENEAAQGSFISEARLHLMRSTMNGLASLNETKICLAKYRKRQRDLWTSSEQEEARERRRLEKDRVNLQLGEDFLENVGFVLSFKSLVLPLKEIRHNRDVQRMFCELTVHAGDEASPAMIGGLVTSSSILKQCRSILKRITTFARDDGCSVECAVQDEQEIPPNGMNDEDDVEASSLERRIAEARKFVDDQRCTPSQKRVAEICH
jgi:hypothetical protein